MTYNGEIVFLWKFTDEHGEDTMLYGKKLGSRSVMVRLGTKAFIDDLKDTGPHWEIRNLVEDDRG